MASPQLWCLNGDESRLCQFCSSPRGANGALIRLPEVPVFLSELFKPFALLRGKNGCELRLRIAHNRLEARAKLLAKIAQLGLCMRENLIHLNPLIGIELEPLRQPFLYQSFDSRGIVNRCRDHVPDYRAGDNDAARYASQIDEPNH